MNPVTPFIVLLLSWSIDSTDPEVQQTINYIFYLVHAILFITMVYLFCRIWASNNTRILQVKDPYTNEIEQMTAIDYDFSKWRELFFTKLLLPVAVGLFVAARWGTPFPLLFQCFTNPLTVFRGPLFQLHALHWAEEGKLWRPWKEDSVMPEWFQKIWQQTQVEEDSNTTGSPTLKNKKRK